MALCLSERTRKKFLFPSFLKKVPGYRIFFKNTMYFHDDPERVGEYINDKSVIHSGSLYIIEGGTKEYRRKDYL